MNPPANWYPDPTGRHGQRYWDGEQWTEHVFTDGVQGLDPLELAAAEQAQASDADADDITHDQTGDEAAPATAAGGDEQPARVEEASGLFADAGDAVPDEAATGTAGEESTWTPQDQTQTSAQADAEEVAPEVEADDVVGTLDEVAPDDGPSGEGTAAAADAALPDQDEEAAPGEDAPPAGDFSDAFMVTPETVSRLVSRQTATEPQEAAAADDQAARDDEELAPVDQPEEPAPDGVEPGAGGGAIDAPPPTVPPGAAGSTAAPPTGESEEADEAVGSITGELLSGAFDEQEQTDPVTLENPRLLRCALGDGPVIARPGAVVAHQGEADFERQGAGGVARALKRAATGEDLALMRVEGTGEVLFADGGQHVFILHLDGGAGLSVNGRNLLAFSAALEWDVERVKGATLLAGGLFNTTLTGTGWVALVSDGEPVVLRTGGAPTHVDVNALVAWSVGLRTETAKSLAGLEQGDAFQMSFHGSGIVVVQPSDGRTGGAPAI